jgi:hypothetical protein
MSKKSILRPPLHTELDEITVRLKEAQNRQAGKELNASTGFIMKRSPAEGSFSQSQISTATYRLGVDIGKGFGGAV